jgi:flavin-binding protein dodecin
MMSVLKIIEISSVSTESFVDAIRKGISRTAKTVRNINVAEIEDQSVTVEEGQVKEFQVKMKVKFAVQD